MTTNHQLQELKKEILEDFDEKFILYQNEGSNIVLFDNDVKKLQEWLFKSLDRVAEGAREDLQDKIEELSKLEVDDDGWDDPLNRGYNQALDDVLASLNPKKGV